jgi:hypothetical protein
MINPTELRDWFAGMVAQGLCSSHDQEGTWTGAGAGQQSVDTARIAYLMADALLARRDEPA